MTTLSIPTLRSDNIRFLTFDPQNREILAEKLNFVLKAWLQDNEYHAASDWLIHYKLKCKAQFCYKNQRILYLMTK